MTGPDVSSEELDLLADLDAGLLEGAELRRAEALAGTDRGRAALEALGRVRAGLGSLPDPAVPPELTDRVRAVVREGTAQQKSADGRARAPRPRPAPAAARWAWAVGVAAALLVGTAVVAEVLRRPADDGLTVAGSAATAESSGRSGLSGDGLEPAGEAAPGPPRGATGETTQDVGAAATGPAGTVAVATGRDYTAEELPAAALALPARSQAASPARGALSLAGVPPELARLRDPRQLTACLTALAGAPVRALAVDLARVEGEPAVVAVVAADDGAPVVHLAGPDCSGEEPDRLPLSPR